MMFYNFKKNFFYHEKIDHKICDMLINFYENSPNKTRGRVGVSELQKDFKVCSEVNVSFKKYVTYSAISSFHTTLDSSCRRLIETFPFIGKLYHWKIDVNLVAWEIVCYEPQHDIFTSSHAVVVSSGFKKEHESQLT